MQLWPSSLLCVHGAHGPHTPRSWLPEAPAAEPGGCRGHSKLSCAPPCPSGTTPPGTLTGRSAFLSGHGFHSHPVCCTWTPRPPRHGRGESTTHQDPLFVWAPQKAKSSDSGSTVGGPRSPAQGSVPPWPWGRAEVPPLLWITGQ